MIKGQQLLLLLCGLLSSTVVCEDCIYQECLCSDNDIFCNQKGLTAIPRKVATTTTSYNLLDLDSNMITSITTESLPTVNEISMMDNPLTNIDDLAFDDSAATLHTLTFSNLAFTRLPDAFTHLENLTSLSIFNSNISDWNPEAIKGFGKTLKTFYAENCGFSSWPDWIQYLSHLVDLSLSINSISSIPDDALDNLTNSLVTLSLVNNSLISIPKAFSKLSALKFLYLSNNRISDVSWLPPTSKLLTLSLSTNNIFNADQLSKALLPYADSLTELDVESNNLAQIPNLVFLSKIFSLDFSQNRIFDPISGSLPLELTSLRLEVNGLSLIPAVLLNVQSVSEMFLTSNAIQAIRAVDFPTWTIGVELGYNLITELTDVSFPVNSSVQYLHLYNNPISQISNNAFNNLPHLNELNLRFTKLARLPVGLVAATSLHYLDFTGSSNLVCTCFEKSLQHWITSLPEENVSGNCGVSSIYFFFSQLSSACPA